MWSYRAAGYIDNDMKEDRRTEVSEYKGMGKKEEKESWKPFKNE